MITRTIEWLNANRRRRYPVRDDSRMTAGRYEIPNNALLDCRLTNCSLPAAPLRLLSVENAHGQLVFMFDYGAAAFHALVPGLVEYPYTVSGSTRGLYHAFIFGEGCADILEFPEGVHALDSPAEIQPALVVTQNRHRVDTVSAVGVGQDVLSGEIYIEPGYNCEPTVVGNEIRLSAGLGFGAGRYCQSLFADKASCANAVSWVNGQRIGSDGNIPLVAGFGVEIENQPDRNRVVVRCSRALENMVCG